MYFLYESNTNTLTFDVRFSSHSSCQVKISGLEHHPPLIPNEVTIVVQCVCVLKMINTTASVRYTHTHTFSINDVTNRFTTGVDFVCFLCCSWFAHVLVPPVAAPCVNSGTAASFPHWAPFRPCLSLRREAVPDMSERFPPYRSVCCYSSMLPGLSL